MIRCPLLSSSLNGQSYRLSFLAALGKQALCERFLLFGHLSLPFTLYVVTIINYTHSQSSFYLRKYQISTGPCGPYSTNDSEMVFVQQFWFNDKTFACKHCKFQNVAILEWLVSCALHSFYVDCYVHQNMFQVSRSLCAPSVKMLSFVQDTEKITGK